ncbi:hypothetical protein ACFWMG_04965 [Streptomyces sp. NPDC127074]|uniref:hypothetical protein n=1 Tax=Streptomyces sp. NPDC127074 TaxID=3347130 RepID=UPI00364BD091
MAAVTPAPGKLAVEYDNGLGPTSKPLDQLPAGTSIEVTATITNFKTLPGHRVTLVIADNNGDTAMVAMDSAVFMAASRATGGLIKAGHTVFLRGTVARRHPPMATIDGRAMRAAR